VQIPLADCASVHHTDLTEPRRASVQRRLDRGRAAATEVRALAATSARIRTPPSGQKEINDVSQRHVRPPPATPGAHQVEDLRPHVLASGDLSSAAWLLTWAVPAAPEPPTTLPPAVTADVRRDRRPARRSPFRHPKTQSGMAPQPRPGPISSGVAAWQEAPTSTGYSVEHR
jgi:hypothetical protein